MIIAKPDLSIGSDVRYTSHATGYGESGIGWEKKTGTWPHSQQWDTDRYFHFMFEVVNSGTETVGSFKVGLLDFEGNPLGVQVGLYWTGTGWAIDASRTTACMGMIDLYATCAEIISEGNKKYVYFAATASQLGMSAGPGEDTNAAYTFYLAVDTEDSVSESNENNNRVPITITAVKEVNTVPSFALSMLGITMSGLLAAVGMSLRRKEEE